MLIRLVKILVLVVFGLSVLTGIRIWLFNKSVLPTPVLGWLDSIYIGGNVFGQYLWLGLVLIALLVILAGYGSWQFLRLKQLKVMASTGWMLRKSIAFAIYTLLATLVFSGILVESGRIRDLLLFATIKNIHLYSFWGLVVLGVVLMIVWILDRKSPKASDYQKAGTVSVDVTIFLVVTLISVAAVFLISKYLDAPAVYVSKNIHRSAVIDGRVRGIEWLGADSTTVLLSDGANFPNETTRLKMKSFHNQQYIYFLFEWDDPGPSFNRSLVKSNNGWLELKSEFSPFGESEYYEDQLAVSFHHNNSNCAQSCHIGAGSNSGLHYTTGDTADLWVWKAVSTNPAFEADDGWWGGNANDSLGGRHYENSPGGGYMLNLNTEWDEPIFLPARRSFENWIWMESDRYMPYRASLDNYPLGATLPSILVSRLSGDRGDIYARGHWQGGVWTVEMSRRKNTGSRFDINFKGEMWLGLAVFNNAEKGHAYHLKPIRFVVER